LAQYGGCEIKTNGDAFVVSFDGQLKAVLWAVDLQHSHHDRPIVTPLGTLEVTIGLHIGTSDWYVRTRSRSQIRI